MKKKRIGLCILIIALVTLVLCLGLFALGIFAPEPERVNKEVYAELGETIRVEKLVSTEEYKSAIISPESFSMENFSDAKVSDDGQLLHMGYTVGEFEVVVYVTDAEGKVTEERVTVVPVIKD